jgi:acyl carrier protein
MRQEEARDAALSIIRNIAPEASLEELDPTRRLRDQFDFDSVDFLNFALALQEKFGISIPELDYPRLAVLDSCVEYLLSRVRG